MGPREVLERGRAGVRRCCKDSEVLVLNNTQKAGERKSQPGRTVSTNRTGVGMAGANGVGWLVGHRGRQKPDGNKS